jgi:hypothetical protein
MGNAKRRVSVLGGSSGTGAPRGAWCTMAATVRGRPARRPSVQPERTDTRVGI